MSTSPILATHEFPLTATQEAYLVGRGAEVAFGSIGCHGYWEWRRTYVPEDELKVKNAWTEVLSRHPSLRTIISERSTQKVLPNTVPWNFTVNNWTYLTGEEAQSRLQKLRETLSHHIFDPSIFPLWDVQVTLMPDRHMLIHFSLDLLIADAWSYYQILVPEFASLMLGQPLDIAPTATFRDWVVEQKEQETKSQSWQRAKRYWTDRLTMLPPAPSLPTGTNGNNTFTRVEDSLDPDHWACLQRVAGNRQITGTALMAAVLGDVFQRWGAGDSFVITVPTFASSRASDKYANVVGDFTSTILLEVDGTGETFDVRARAVQRQLWSDLPHASFSGIHVAREIAKVTGSTDVGYPVVLTSLLGQPPRHFHTALGDSTYTSTQTPQVSLDIQVAEVDGALNWSWDFRTSAFPSGLMEDMFVEFGRTLRLLIRETSWMTTGLLAQLPSHQARSRLVANSTDGPIPGLPLPLMLLKQAQQRPEAPALIDQDGMTLTYEDLSEQIMRLAGILDARAQGLGPIAIILKKQVAQIVAAHAVSHTGRTFIPLDAGQPAARLAKALRSAGPSLIITSADLVEQLSSLSEAPVIITPSSHSNESLRESRCGVSDCYVVYTSGSSGEPKGVIVPHTGVANSFAHMIELGHIGSGDVAYAVSPFHFDLGMFETLGTFAFGAAVVMAPDEVDPLRWLRDVQHHGITVWNSTPGLLGLLLDAAEAQEEMLLSLRTVILSGDRIPGNLPNRLRHLAPHAKLIASGGPAETCVWSIYYSVPPEFPKDSERVPYGRPMKNQRYLILDEHGLDVPDWVCGEMFVESVVGLASGYLNLPDQTAQKFTISEATGRRRYRTGDLGRWTPDGQIEILGRKDFQVKINGIRIELGEVTEALKAIPDIDDAVAVQAGQTSEAPLVAFVVSQNLGLSENAIRTRIADLLPRAALPARIIVTPKLPLTVNGKVDLRSLQLTAAEVVTAATVAQKESAKPGPVETVLLACWSSILGRAIGWDENFFTAGATSLDVAKTTMRFALITELDIDARVLFIHSTVRAAAAALSAKHGSDVLARCKLVSEA